MNLDNNANVVCEIKHFAEAPKNTLAALVENTARKNWNVVALAKTLKELNEQGYQINQLADLIGKHRQTIGRLLKVAGGNHEILDLIMHYPDKLNTIAVLNVTNKELSEKEVLNRFKELTGLIKVDYKTQKFERNQIKATNFIKERKLPEPQKKLVMEVLMEFGFLMRR